MSELEKLLDDYWNKSREFESHAVNDLEKHLWLVNSAAATITIGFIQSNEVVNCLQVMAGWIFVLGIIFLLLMKFVSELNSSRDRFRFQSATKGITEKNAELRIKEIKDKTFAHLKLVYLILKFGSGILFIVGCIFILLGVT